eukprot:TRINITY_DN16591_c0_g1_i1.p1 TRINITY_DN16591_c0_g1~~TRINITY_DN16591_c0_g1_i1.p1  ORF type:complete len:396 (+),score=106.16 TRINITY_DN16591_c0_g1_i1:119-1189(+)
MDAAYRDVICKHNGHLFQGAYDSPGHLIPAAMAPPTYLLNYVCMSRKSNSDGGCWWTSEILLSKRVKPDCLTMNVELRFEYPDRLFGPHVLDRWRPTEMFHTFTVAACNALDYRCFAWIRVVNRQPNLFRAKYEYVALASLLRNIKNWAVLLLHREPKTQIVDWSCNNDDLRAIWDLGHPTGWVDTATGGLTADALAMISTDFTQAAIYRSGNQYLQLATGGATALTLLQSGVFPNIVWSFKGQELLAHTGGGELALCYLDVPPNAPVLIVQPRGQCLVTGAWSVRYRTDLLKKPSGNYEFRSSTTTNARLVYTANTGAVYELKAVSGVPVLAQYDTSLPETFQWTIWYKQVQQYQ